MLKRRLSHLALFKGISVATRINFDDHKLFEGTTNVFSIFGDYFFDVSDSLRD